jgi:hypothetical protein
MKTYFERPKSSIEFMARFEVNLDAQIENVGKRRINPVFLTTLPTLPLPSSPVACAKTSHRQGCRRVTLFLFRLDVRAEELEHVRHGAGDDPSVIQSGHFLPLAVHASSLKLLCQGASTAP